MTPSIYTHARRRATKPPLAVNRHPSASFSRQAVFDAFGARHARALDQGGFTDHSPDAQMRLAPGSWFQKGAAS